MRLGVIWVLLALWAVAVALSVNAMFQPPTGDGFARGLNRIEGFLGYQAAALVIALIVLSVRGWAEARWLRRLTLVPILLALALVLGPAALSVRNNPNLGLSQFSPALGGPRGAATLGFGRGFWGHAVRPLLPALEHRKVFLHDVHELARRQYEREGQWPADAKSVPLSQSNAALLFHELHMTSDEVRLWNRFGPAPSQVLELDDVPLTSLYGTTAQ